MAPIPSPLTVVVDSGADAIMIPVRYLQQIRARRGRTKWMRGTTGGRVLVSLYPISLKLGSFVQAHLEVVGDTTNEEPILGRDILNHLSVNLNGPTNVVEISYDA
jgi:predicted aspartyl protease